MLHQTGNCFASWLENENDSPYHKRICVLTNCRLTIRGHVDFSVRLTAPRYRSRQGYLYHKDIEQQKTESGTSGLLYWRGLSYTGRGKFAWMEFDFSWPFKERTTLSGTMKSLLTHTLWMASWKHSSPKLFTWTFLLVFYGLSSDMSSTMTVLSLASSSTSSTSSR